MEDIANENGSEILKPGYKMQVGWSILQIGQSSDGELILLEPDYSDDPFKRTREDLTCTLSIQAEQNDFNIAVSASPFVTSFQDKIIYSKSSLDQKNIYLERKSPRLNDSGWFIGTNDRNISNYDIDNLAACYTYELLKIRPAIMKVLQMPPGYLIVFDGSEVEAVLNPENEVVYSR